MAVPPGVNAALAVPCQAGSGCGFDAAHRVLARCVFCGQQAPEFTCRCDLLRLRAGKTWCGRCSGPVAFAAMM